MAQYLYILKQRTIINGVTYGIGQVAEVSDSFSTTQVYAKGTARVATTDERNAYLASVAAVEAYQADGLESVIVEAVAGDATAAGDTLGELEDRLATLEGAEPAASALSDLSDVVISSPAEDQILKYDGENWVNGEGGGAIGFNLYSPDVPYTAPSTEDDEFEGASIAGKWTAIGTPTAAFNVPPSMMTVLGADNGITGYYQTIAGGIVFRAKMHLAGAPVSAATPSGGLFASNAAGTYIKEISARLYRPSATNNSVDVQVSYRAGRTNGDYTQQHYNGTTQVGGQVIYFEISKVASGSDFIYNYSYSLDGISFIPCYTQTIAAASVDLVRFGFHALSTTYPARIDWFRKLQGNYTGALIAY